MYGALRVSPRIVSIVFFFISKRGEVVFFLMGYCIDSYGTKRKRKGPILVHFSPIFILFLFLEGRSTHTWFFGGLIYLGSLSPGYFLTTLWPPSHHKYPALLTTSLTNWIWKGECISADDKGRSILTVQTIRVVSKHQSRDTDFFYRYFLSSGATHLNILRERERHLEIVLCRHSAKLYIVSINTGAPLLFLMMVELYISFFCSQPPTNFCFFLLIREVEGMIP